MGKVKLLVLKQGLQHILLHDFLKRKYFKLTTVRGLASTKGGGAGGGEFGPAELLSRRIDNMEEKT